ncbi:hypothetical protein [Dyadobacter sp. CY356]|uniref:hypothetical protein n=1 Tax=Dyadobacter sp. CY356 TaxID=2906442 RepID=UPI001F16167C|nr:hypothetical protein [Dyadobacter sp. CY356]MCF0059847.1 hypothetical protein [Dyadobacter sp. CY356]
MKNLLFLTAVFGILLSCSHKEDDPEGLAAKFISEKFPQKWQLVSIQGNISNMPPKTGSKMEWQEFYLLNADGTLSKTRERDGVIRTITGKYSFKSIGIDNFLEVTYDSDSDIIGNCYGTPTEELFIKSNVQFESTWQACDGPGLVYNRVE